MLTASFDRDAMRRERAAWGLFRDRRPELYGVLATADGAASRTIAMRYVISLLAVVALAGCGMDKAAHDTGRMFDKYGCLAKELKGEKPCVPAE